MVTQKSEKNLAMALKTSFCLLSALLVVGCLPTAGFLPKTDIEAFPKEGLLSSSPSVDNTMVQDPKNHRIICMGRGADAVFETSDSGDFKLSLINVGNSGGGDEAKVTDNAGEEEMMGRTPAILMARELFYRACELTNNAKLSRDEALKVFNSVLNVVSQGWSKESENTKITIGDQIIPKIVEGQPSSELGPPGEGEGPPGQGAEPPGQGEGPPPS